MSKETFDSEGNLIPEQAMVSVLSKAEIDQQIATAKKYPRDVDRFVARATSLVGKTVESAQQCIYALPRDGKIIKGPSARFAEILLSTWGNIRAGARVVDDTGNFVVAQGVFHDLESNTAITYEVQRRIVDKHGRRYKDDMVGVTANAACSIALRNAALRGIPKAIWQPIYEQAERVGVGDVKTLTARRDKALAMAAKFGAPAERVFAVLEVTGPEGIDNDKLFTLCTLLQSVKDAELSVDSAFRLNERAPAAALNEKMKQVEDAENDAPEKDAGADASAAEQEGPGATPDAGGPEPGPEASDSEHAAQGQPQAGKPPAAARSRARGGRKVAQTAPAASPAPDLGNLDME